MNKRRLNLRGMMQRRKTKIFFALLIPLIGVTLTVWLCFAPPPTYSLLERATKVTEVPKSGSAKWLTSDELLLETTNQPIQPTRQTAWSGYFESIDARTGRHTRLEGLSKAIIAHARFGDGSAGPIGFTPSPGGQWLLSENLFADGHAATVTIHIDGSGYCAWKPDDEHRWMDGHRWVSIFYRPQEMSDVYEPKSLIIHDAARPNADRALAYPSPEAEAIYNPDTWSSPQQLWSVSYTDPVTKKPSGVAFKIYQTPGEVSKTKRVTPIAAITFPPDTHILEKNVNPQNTRIEFLVNENGVPAYVTLLRRFYPNYPYPAHRIVCLCVFRADTRKLVEIGRVEDSAASEGYNLGVAWLPDGKHLQFNYNHALYRVSTD